MIVQHSKNGNRGSTLIELLVVMAILSVFLTMTAVVSKGAIELNGTTKSRAAAERNAAAFMRQFGSDISQRVKRAEARAKIDKHEGNDEISMLTLRQGFALHSTTADRKASLVSYRVEKNMLERAASGYGFGASESRPAEKSGTLALKDISAAGPDEPDSKAFQIIAPGVIRLEFSFLVLESGERVMRAQPPVDQSLIEAVIATVVTLDPERGRVLESGKLELIAKEFPDAADNELPLDKWAAIAADLSTKVPSVRKTALQQVRVHQGLFTLPNRNFLP